jgi:hypothetical protein
MALLKVKALPTFLIGWSATEVATLANFGSNIDPIVRNFTVLCQLLSQMPRAIILLLGSSHDGRVDDQWDDCIQICRDEAAIYGILTHNFLTIVPKMTRFTNATGYVDPWHFAATDENRAIQAQALYNMIELVELLRPSSVDWSHSAAHSWDCPAARVKCICGENLANDRRMLADHHSRCEHIKHAWFDDCHWQFLEPMACWSKTQCIRCQTTFLPVPDRWAELATEAQGPLTSRSAESDADVDMLPDFETVAEEEEDVEEEPEPFDAEQHAETVNDLIAQATAAASGAVPTPVAATPAVWLRDGKPVSMEQFNTLGDGFKSMNTFVHQQAERERMVALSKISAKEDVAAEEIVDEKTKLDIDADMFYSIAMAAEAQDGACPIPAMNIYQGAWKRTELASGRNIWVTDKPKTSKIHTAPSDEAAPCTDDAHMNTVPGPGPVDLAVGGSPAASGTTSSSSTSVRGEDVVEELMFTSTLCGKCGHYFKVIKGKGDAQSKFCRHCGLKRERTSPSPVGPSPVTDAEEEQEDLTNKYKFFQVQLTKRANEPTGIAFYEPELHMKRGVLVHSIANSSFAAGQNASAIDTGSADGFLPHDIIVQVDATVGATLGDTGGSEMIKAMNKAESCTIHIVRRADRFIAYLKECNIQTMRSEEHELAFVPPSTMPSTIHEDSPQEWAPPIPRSVSDDYRANLNMHEEYVLAQEIEAHRDDDHDTPPSVDRAADAGEGVGSFPPTIAGSVIDEPSLPVIDEDDEGVEAAWRGIQPVRPPVIHWSDPVYGIGRSTNIGMNMPRVKHVMRADWHFDRLPLWKQQISTGKKMSCVLRHKSADMHLKTMRSDGYVSMKEVWDNCEFLHTKAKAIGNGRYVDWIDDKWIRTMNGSTDEKARFEFFPKEYNRPIVFVRGLQGHSDRAIDNSEVTTRITRANQPEITVHTTSHGAVQPILATGIKPGGPQATRNEFLSQSKWGGNPKLKPGGFKLAPVGIEWDCVQWTEGGAIAGITGQAAVSVTQTMRRPYLCRAFHMPKVGPPQPSDIIYERRNDCPEALKTNAVVGPGEKGNFCCSNLIGQPRGPTYVKGATCPPLTITTTFVL